MALVLNLAADTTAPRTTRRVYSAQELQRLRSAQSLPKLREAIEKHDSEDAEIVKEHVLRGSKSFAAHSFRSRPSVHSLRVPSSRSNIENLSVGNSSSDTVPRQTITQSVPLASSSSSSSSNVLANSILGAIAPNNQMLRTGPLNNKLRPSPTPSLKRKKAEAIVKAHGSPTHIRVTAGGRIVPSEQSPLCYPRYGYSAINLNGGLIKFAPNVQAGQPQWTKATEDGFVAQDEQGNLSQIVNGTILPLHEVDGALRLYMPAPNLKISANSTQRNASQPPAKPAMDFNSGKQQDAPPVVPVAVPEVSVDAQIHALDVEYSKLERELKELDKTEVIHGRAMSRVAKEALFAQRRSLVAGLDRLRRGIKALKSRPPPNAPTSPRAMSARQQASPPRNRLPPFLQTQQAGNMLSSQFPQGLDYQAPPPPSFGGQYGPPVPTDESYAGHAWAVPPPGVFAPPAFDGSFSLYTQAPALGFNAQPPIAPPVADIAVPQSDGARSFADLPVASPPRSRAVSIKAPDAKPTTNLKSSLNPMSPVYKPGSGQLKNVVDIKEEQKKEQTVQDALSTMLPTARQLATVPQNKSAAATTSPDTTFNVSPSRKSGHLHSSSISSFETADFFPRNPREYSTRQHIYPIGVDSTEDKENHPHGQASDKNNSPATPGQVPTQELYRATAAPPGTPVLDSQGRPAIPTKLDGYREEHNVSPKSKREWLFVAENPADATSQPLPSSSPVKTQPSLEAVKRLPANTLDFSQKPREWIEGFQAGLHRRSVGSDCNAEFMDGYLSGLLRAKPKVAGPVSVAASTGSPMRTISRRPSPAMMSRPSSRLQLVEQAPVATRPPFETAAQSMDTLKQAVFAPQNENAMFTPAPDGPSVTDAAPNILGWPKSKPQPASAASANALPAFPFPKRTSSVVKQHRVLSECNPPQQMGKFQDPRRVTVADLSGPYLGPSTMDRFSNQPASPALSTMSITSGSESNNSHRVMSLSGIDSSLARQWPASRIITPIGSSVAHAAGLATGYFASAQFDGAPRATSITSAGPSRPNAGRFREGSLDGVTLPPSSPSPSQPVSPNQTPRGRRKDSSPSKGPSPAKATFEHIAEKVGIKVSTTPAA